jgi:hypothetical protein
MHTTLNSPKKTKNGFSLDNTERSIDPTILINDMELLAGHSPKDDARINTVKNSVSGSNLHPNEN